MPKAAAVSAEEAALNFLNYRMRTEKELREKLLSKGYSEEDIESCMAVLKESALVDDRRYALEYIEAAAQKGRGDLRIKRELAQKGVDRFVIEDAFYEREELSEAGNGAESEEERAYKVALRLRETYRGEEKDFEKKLIGKLRTQGYGFGSAYAVAKRMRKEVR